MSRRNRGRAAAPPRRRSPIGRIALVAAIAGAGAFWWWEAGRDAEAIVPTYEAADRLDPAVREALARAVDRARTDPGASAFGDLGRVYHAHELTDLAERSYELALSADGARPEWRYYLARIAADRGDVARAAELFREVTRAAPDYPAAWYHLGLALLAIGDLDVADAAFAKHAEIAPTRSWGELGQARVALRRGRHEDALALLRRAVVGQRPIREAVYLRATTARELGHAQEADEALARLASLPDAVAPPDPWMQSVGAERTGTLETLRAAQRREAAGDVNGAVALYRQVLQRQFDHYSALVGLGQLLRRQRRVEEAEGYLMRAVESDPDQAHAHALLAGLYLESGRIAEAEAAAAEAVRLDPAAANAQFYLGASRVALDRCDEALAPLQRALELEPRILDARIVLAGCHRRAGRPDRARAELEQVLAVAPQHPAARTALAALDGGGSP